MRTWLGSLVCSESELTVCWRNCARLVVLRWGIAAPAGTQAGTQEGISATVGRLEGGRDGRARTGR